MKNQDISYVDTVKVKCDGEKQTIGHPLIYLHLDNNGEAECPYCSKLFKLKTKKG